MIDLHCHILPATDDGAADLDEALAMARFYVADGVTHVVATPHCHRQYRTLRADVLPRVAALADALAAADIPLAVIPGSEIQVPDSAVYRREFEAGLYCHLGDRPAFTLLEFSWKADLYPADAAELIRWIRDRGTTPIVAHPERHAFFADDPGRLRALADAGAWVQLTVDSLLGNFGPAPRAAGEAILRDYPEAVLASDAHSMRRCSGLAAGYRWVRERFGEGRETDLRERGGRVLAAITNA
jgi:protein-tyrosine phosphatase